MNPSYRWAVNVIHESEQYLVGVPCAHKRYGDRIYHIDRHARSTHGYSKVSYPIIAHAILISHDDYSNDNGNLQLATAPDIFSNEWFDSNGNKKCEVQIRLSVFYCISRCCILETRNANFTKTRKLTY